MNLIDHLAYELTHRSADRGAAMRLAWPEVETLEALRMQIQDTRSILLRRSIRVAIRQP